MRTATKTCSLGRISSAWTLKPAGRTRESVLFCSEMVTAAFEHCPRRSQEFRSTESSEGAQLLILMLMVRLIWWWVKTGGRPNFFVTRVVLQLAESDCMDPGEMQQRWAQLCGSSLGTASGRLESFAKVAATGRKIPRLFF